MAIDAFTLIAQVVNFLVLLVLLRAFLFRPVQRVMAERERRIAEEHAVAERARSDAEAEARALHDERETLVAQRRERVAELERELERTRLERLDEVRAEAEAARASWRNDLERSRRDTADELRRLAPSLLADALRRGWRELADEDLEARAVTTFARRLAELDDDTRAALGAAVAAGPVTVATAFEPTRAQREALTSALSGVSGVAGEVAFERDPVLVAGVALRAGDLRVGWSVDDHVSGLSRAWTAANAPDTLGAGRDEGAAP
jgi:F-type H+-transporting ATPase subunit b